MTTLFIIKFGSGRMKTVGVASWFIFAPVECRVNKNEKIILNSESFEKGKRCSGDMVHR